MIGVQIGSKGLAGFDRPIDLLKDCHRRIEHFLRVLEIVVERFGEGDLPEEGRRALETALNYFAHAAPRHTADEEESLFPRLRDHAQAAKVMADLQQLEADHRQAEAWHAEVEELGRQWLREGHIDEPGRASLRALLEKLTASYADHIRFEEERVFFLAKQVLLPHDLTEVGLEMRQRRFEDASS